MIRLAFQKTPDSLELSVREPERAVQRLFRNLRQAISVTPASDGTVRPVPVRDATAGALLREGRA
jgi:hypothetical protein